MKVTKKDIGKKITFKEATRAGCDKTTRILRGITPEGKLIVRYQGWNVFYLHPHEVIEIEDKGA